MCSSIMLIRMKERRDTATKVQEALTEFGCNISVRLGLHDSAGDSCSEDGIVILKLCGDTKEHEALAKALNDIEGIRAKLININDI